MLTEFDDKEPDERREAAFDAFNNVIDDWELKIKSSFFSNCSEKELQSRLGDFSNSLHKSVCYIQEAEFILGFLAGFTICNQINDYSKIMDLACFAQKKIPIV